MIIVRGLLGAPGAGKGTRRPSSADAPRAPARRDRRPLPGRRPRPRRRSGWRRRRYMDARAARARRRSRSGCSLERLAAAGCRRRGDPRRLSAQRPSRPRRSTSALAERGTACRARPCSSTCPPKSSSSACRAAASATPPGTSTTRRSIRRAVPGVCDLDGSTLIQRADDTPGDDPGPPERHARRPVRGRRPLPRHVGAPDRGWATADPGRRRGAPRRAGLRRPRSGPCRRGLTGDGVPASRSAEIEKMRRAGRIVAEVLALVESELQPGVSTAPPRPPGRGAHPRVPAPSRRSRATSAASTRGPALPGKHLHLASTTRSSTASPATATIREGQIVSRRRRAPSSMAGMATPRGRSIVGEAAGRACATWSTPPGWRMMAGIAAAVPGNHIEDISAAVEDVATRRPATGSSASSSATASAPRCTRSRRSPTTGPAIAGCELEAGLCLAIEPMFTLGGDDVEVLGGRLDRRDRRRLAGGPLRAHHRGHRATVRRSSTSRLNRRLPGQRQFLIRYAFVCRPAGPALVVRKGSTIQPVAKKDAIEVEGTVIEPLPEHHVRGRAGERPPGARPHQRQAPDELHPDPAR